MAFEGAQIKVPGLKASADLSAKQYYFVKLSGVGTVDVCSAVTDKPIGVLQNAPVSGDAAEVCGLGVTKVSSDSALTAGNLIGTSADGQAAPYVAGTDTTKYICGQAIDTTTAANGLATATVNCFSIARGA